MTTVAEIPEVAEVTQNLKNQVGDDKLKNGGLVEETVDNCNNATIHNSRSVAIATIDEFNKNNSEPLTNAIEHAYNQENIQYDVVKPKTGILNCMIIPTEESQIQVEVVNGTENFDSSSKIENSRSVQNEAPASVDLTFRDAGPTEIQKDTNVFPHEENIISASDENLLSVAKTGSTKPQDVILKDTSMTVEPNRRLSSPGYSTPSIPSKTFPSTIASASPETWAHLSNLSLESPKMTQQSPITLSRSSSVSKRSRSSSSISPRSPRFGMYDDDSSVFELCREAESIRQYIDSEFLSNLLLKGEREKLAQRKSKDMTGSNWETKDEHKMASTEAVDDVPNQERDMNALTNSIEVTDAEGITKINLNNEDHDTLKCTISPKQPCALDQAVINSVSEDRDSATLATHGRSQTTIKVEDSDIVEMSSLVPIIKAKSSPSSPEARESSPSANIPICPPPHLLALSSNSLEVADPTSPAISPSPSPTFSKSSFALNSQFLRSLSTSTQELLNSLVVSSSVEIDKSPSPDPESTTQEAEQGDGEIELALPNLAPSTTRAICKLFSAANDVESYPVHKTESNSSYDSSNLDSNKISLPVNEPSENINQSSNTNGDLIGESNIRSPNESNPIQSGRCFEENENGIMNEKSGSSPIEVELEKELKLLLRNERERDREQDDLSDVDSMIKNENEDTDSNTVVTERNDIKSVYREKPISQERKTCDQVNKQPYQSFNISSHDVDEDILLQERALDEILAPNSFHELPLMYSSATPLELSSHFVLREVPTLQELASASLPSARPVSSAIISFDKANDLDIPGRTHLKRRFNSPEVRNPPTTRLSLRDKFERDLHSKPRAKHSKSLSKNARFQKGPSSRVNSQEKVEKTGSKLDKSKSESRIGESFNHDSDSPADDREQTGEALEEKKQTTVKFAPLNIEIPHYREPEMEDPVVDDDRSSDVEDFLSPSDEITAEMIRKRLWAGLRSFSVDVDILQAYGILTNSGDNQHSSLLSSLSEQPSIEAEFESTRSGSNQPKRKTSMTAEDLEFLEMKRNTRRRGSVAALQELVKENTQVIEKVLKQKRFSDRENKKNNSTDDAVATCATENESSEQDKITSQLFEEAILRTSQNICERLQATDADIISESATETEAYAKLTTPAVPSSSSLRVFTGNDSENISKFEETDCNRDQQIPKPISVNADNNHLQQATKHGSVVSLKSQNSVDTETALVSQTTNLEASTVSDFSSDVTQRQAKGLIVTQKDFDEKDGGCFKLPLSAFCVSSSSRDTQLADSNTIVPLDKNPIIAESNIIKSGGDITKLTSASNISSLTSASNISSDPNQLSIASLDISRQEPKSPSAVANLDERNLGNNVLSEKHSSSSSAESFSSQPNAKFSVQEIKQSQYKGKVIEDSSASRTTACELNVLTRSSSNEYRNTVSSKSSESSSISTASEDSSRPSSSTSSTASKLFLPVSPRPKTQYSKQSPSDRASPNWSKIPCPNNELNVDHRTRPITFNPFPPRNASLHRKEVSVKLGLYSPVSK